MASGFAAANGDVQGSLCNPDLLEYARSLRDTGNRSHLHNLALRVYQQANRILRLSGVQSDGNGNGGLREPSADMSLDALLISIVSNCMAAEFSRSPASENGPARGSGFADDQRGGARAAAGGSSCALRNHGASNNPGAGARNGRGAQEILVDDPRQMAIPLIYAQRFKDRPESDEALLAQQKGINWLTQVDNDGDVRVTRSRNGGTSRCYVYKCDSEDAFKDLVDNVEQERLHLLQNGDFSRRLTM